MSMSLQIFLLFIGSLQAKLVVRDLSEIYKDGRVNVDLLRSEAELVDVKLVPSDSCEHVEEKLEFFKVWVGEQEGSAPLVEKIVDVGTMLDVAHITLTVYNAMDPSIKSDIIIRPLYNCFQPDHSYLVKAIRNNLLIPPSRLPYSFDINEFKLYAQNGQPFYLDRVIFKGKVKNGFFIEAGADNFETDSNTLYFEKKLGWTGLLVEPNPTIFPVGLAKNRKAWAAFTCLATEEKPHTAFFTQKAVHGGMAGLVPNETPETYRMQCIPLYTLLLAVGNRTVNYLSLDIEGAELQVLQSVPWEKIDIEVISVETNHAGEVFPGSQEDIRDYLRSKGYEMTHVVGVDDMFVRSDLLAGKYKPDLEAYERFASTNFAPCVVDNERIKFYRLVTDILNPSRKREIPP